VSVPSLFQESKGEWFVFQCKELSFFVSENHNIYLQKSEALLKVTIIVCILFVDCFTAWWQVLRSVPKPKSAEAGAVQHCG